MGPPRTRDFLEYLKRSGFAMLRVAWGSHDGKRRVVPRLDYILRQVAQGDRSTEFVQMLQENVPTEVEEEFRSLADVLFDEGFEKGKAGAEVLAVL